MPYFKLTDQTTPADLRKQWIKLCKRYHPDMEGGSHSIQLQINNEYEEALKELAAREKQKGDISLHNQIMQQLENHVLRNMDLYKGIFNEIKTKVPVQYHGLMDEFLKIIINK